MAANEGWIYQGRQSHGWFGHGTAPRDLGSPPTEAGALFDPAEAKQRVAYVVSSILGHVPRADLTWWEAAVAGASVDAWTKMVQARQAASGLGRDAFRNRFLDPYANDSLVDSLRQVGRHMIEGRTYEDLAAAGQGLVLAAQQVGVDRWPRFIANALRNGPPTAFGQSPSERDLFRAVGSAFDPDPRGIHLVADDQLSHILAVQNQLLKITQKIVQNESNLGATGYVIPARFTAATYGTYLHVLFREAVESAKIPGVLVEESFIDGRDAEYGEASSIRTDVILKHSSGVVAVWDYKTGIFARMSASRADKIRAAIKSNYGDIPVYIIKVFFNTVEER